VLDEYIDDRSAPFGLLCKSRKTGQYVWFCRSKVIEYHDAPPGTRTLVPEMIEGVRAYTYNQELLLEYLDHLMNNVLSKRDQKKYKELYSRAGNLPDNSRELNQSPHPVP
jgi:hypothetical protein